MSDIKGQKKCPYNRKSLRQISEYVNDLVNEEVGVIRSNQEIINEEYELMDCYGENCGCYYNGRCRYYMSIDENIT